MESAWHRHIRNKGSSRQRQQEQGHQWFRQQAAALPGDGLRATGSPEGGMWDTAFALTANIADLDFVAAITTAVYKAAKLNRSSCRTSGKLFLKRMLHMNGVRRRSCSSSVMSPTGTVAGGAAGLAARCCPPPPPAAAAACLLPAPGPGGPRPPGAPGGGGACWLLCLCCCWPGCCCCETQDEAVDEAVVA
jgi:hypothetical protein